MNKRNAIGAILLFIGSFLATKQLFAKGEWNTNHYIILAACAILMALGIYAVLTANAKEK